MFIFIGDKCVCSASHHLFSPAWSACEWVESITAVSSFPRAIGQFHIKQSRDDCVQSEAERPRFSQWHFHSEKPPHWHWCSRSNQAMEITYAQAAIGLPHLCQHISFTSKWRQTQHTDEQRAFGGRRGEICGARRPSAAPRRRDERGHPN